MRVAQHGSVVVDARPFAIEHDRDFATVHALLDVSIVNAVGPDLGLGYRAPPHASLLSDMLESLLEPVQAQPDDERVDGDRVRKQRPQVQDYLLESIEQIDVNRVQAS